MLSLIRARWHARVFQLNCFVFFLLCTSLCTINMFKLGEDNGGHQDIPGHLWRIWNLPIIENVIICHFQILVSAYGYVRTRECFICMDTCVGVCEGVMHGRVCVMVEAHCWNWNIAQSHQWCTAEVCSSFILENLAVIAGACESSD